MSDRTYKVLFVCAGNSARSMVAEAVFNRDCEGRFSASSAASFPKVATSPRADVA